MVVIFLLRCVKLSCLCSCWFFFELFCAAVGMSYMSFPVFDSLLLSKESASSPWVENFDCILSSFSMGSMGYRLLKLGYLFSAAGCGLSFLCFMYVFGFSYYLYHLFQWTFPAPSKLVSAMFIMSVEAAFFSLGASFFALCHSMAVLMYLSACENLMGGNKVAWFTAVVVASTLAFFSLMLFVSPVVHAESKLPTCMSYNEMCLYSLGLNNSKHFPPRGADISLIYTQASSEVGFIQSYVLSEDEMAEGLKLSKQYNTNMFVLHSVVSNYNHPAYSSYAPWSGFNYKDFYRYGLVQGNSSGVYPSCFALNASYGNDFMVKVWEESVKYASTSTLLTQLDCWRNIDKVVPVNWGHLITKPQVLGPYKKATLLMNQELFPYVWVRGEG